MQPEQNNPTTPQPLASEPVNNTAAPVAAGTTPLVSGQMNATPVPAAEQSKKKKTLMLAGLIAGAAVLLSGAGAGAYFGIVVPNKPENVLKKAIENTARQNNGSFKGTLSLESTDPENKMASEIKFNGQADSNAKAAQTLVDVTVNGINLPVELRYIEENGYIKVGDLKTIRGLAESYAPGTGPIVEQLDKSLSNQWVEFDKTLTKQAGVDCALNASFTTLTDQDIKLLQNRYKEVQFTQIKSTANDTVNGKSAVKYELELDDNKLSEYAKGLNELSFIKKLKECSDQKESIDESIKELADNDKTPLTLWVDKKSKTIVKMAGKTTKQDEEKDKTKGSYEMTFEYGNAKVSKPEGAKPAAQVLSEIGPAFQGLLGAGLSGAEGSSELDQRCAAAYEAWAQSGDDSMIPAECQTL